MVCFSMNLAVPETAQLREPAGPKGAAEASVQDVCMKDGRRGYAAKKPDQTLWFMA